MDDRAAKLAAARQKLKHHREKRVRSENTKPLIEDNVPKDKQEFESSKATEKNLDTALIPEPNYVTQSVPDFIENNIHVTEILISDKTKLEAQVKDLEFQLFQIKQNYAQAIDHQNITMQSVSRLELELQTIKNNYSAIQEENLMQSKLIAGLQNKISVLTDENNNLLEQLEFTKTILTTKENENLFYKNQTTELENQIESFKLQIKQITNDPNINVTQNVEDRAVKEELNEKISNLQEKLQAIQKERDNLSSHYEHYVNDLNNQLKTMTSENNNLSQQLNELYNRENSLIDQISDLEKRLQSYQIKVVTEENKNTNELQEKLKSFENQYHELNLLYQGLQNKYIESQEQIKVMNENNEINNDKDNISISKLNADITSDKLAAQRATEQNKKLKTDLEELEFAFVKMSKDKLDLTEMLTHEKQLSKELMLKLADVEESSKDLYRKVMAKDEEMIRLQNSYRNLEKDYEDVLSKYQQLKEMRQNSIPENKTDINFNEQSIPQLLNGENEDRKEIIDHNNEELRLTIAKEDAMLKLQERFLNIMDEVANLSDEKHMLEHIILQLQNETDTICEYIALYQQQRSLLKKRDEDRSEQIKMFQIESNKLKNHLEELSNLLIRFANDKDLTIYLQNESRKNDLAKVMELLTNLKNSALITSNHKSLDFKNFYPCNCCSGQIMDV